ncbi:MAG: hypothetical protein ACKOX3_04780 [Bacteroidota bacterium]
MKGNKILFYVTAAMSALYPIVGIYILLAPNVEILLPGNKRYLIGSMLLIYGVFRFFRLKSMKKNMDNVEQPTNSSE